MSASSTENVSFVRLLSKFYKTMFLFYIAISQREYGTVTANTFRHRKVGLVGERRNNVAQ